MQKLDQEQVASAAPGLTRSIPSHQVAVFTMCGGGVLGTMAAHQPADFYIDDRCGRLPYGRRQITQAVATLATIAAELGLNPHDMPAMPRFHCCGIF